MEIIALVSVFREDDLLNSCINSAVALDKIMVFDGPIGQPNNPPNKVISKRQVRMTPQHIHYDYYEGLWNSDANKRTTILKEAQAHNPDAWALWLDGDEILLYGEYLRDHCYRAEKETGTGGTTIRIVEYDGSVAQCFGKLIKVGNVRSYLMSSYEVELTNGLTIALPNVPICSAGGIPIGEIKERDDPILALNRPPLIGEPHLLHRHGLRDPNRQAPRLHDKEAESFQKLVEERK